jgi:DNA polymerase III epsilon subunit-like protein
MRRGKIPQSIGLCIHVCQSVEVLAGPVTLLNAALPRLAFLDIETTGLNSSVDEVIEIGVLVVDNGVEVLARQWLVRPSRSLPPLIELLTGLDDVMLLDAPQLDAIASEVSEALGSATVVAHNAAFERSFLGEIVRSRPVVDSCELAQLLLPQLPHHDLDGLAGWAEVPPRSAHRALDDARMTRLVTEAMLAQVELKRLEVLVSRLRPNPLFQTADSHALFAILLHTLEARRSAPRRNEETGRLARPDQKLVDAMCQPTPVVLEYESMIDWPTVAASLRAAAFRLGERLTLSVSESQLLDIAGRTGLPIFQRHTVALSAIERLVIDSESAQRSAAFLHAKVAAQLPLIGLRFMSALHPALVSQVAELSRLALTSSPRFEMPVAVAVHADALHSDSRLVVLPVTADLQASDGEGGLVSEAFARHFLKKGGVMLSTRRHQSPALAQQFSNGRVVVCSRASRRPVEFCASSDALTLSPALWQLVLGEHLDKAGAAEVLLPAVRKQRARLIFRRASALGNQPLLIAGVTDAHALRAVLLQVPPAVERVIVLGERATLATHLDGVLGD